MSHPITSIIRLCLILWMGAGIGMASAACPDHGQDTEAIRILDGTHGDHDCCTVSSWQPRREPALTQDLQWKVVAHVRESGPSATILSPLFHGPPQTVSIPFRPPLYLLNQTFLC